MQTSRSTLNWTDYLSWEKNILALLADYVDEEVIDCFRANPPEFVVSDDTSWLDEIVQNIKGVRVDVKYELASLLSENYETLRAFHGCSPVETNSYYEQGIRRLDPKEYDQIARDHFLSAQFPELVESDLLAAIEDMKTDNRAGLVFFEANEKVLLNFCGHYMLYGSEYLLGIAAKLSGDRRDYRRTLKGRGTPSVFVCDVPLKLIGFDYVLELAGSIIVILFEKFLDEDYRHPQHGDCFGF